MSMIAILLRVSNEQLEAFLENSSLLEEYVDSGEMDESESQLDIDKAWDGINYLLTGHGINTLENVQSPFAQVLFSGQLIDEEQDMGYGPAQYLTSEQVKEISNALTKVSVDDLKGKYNADKMNKADVYPTSWGEDGDEKDYLIDYFTELKEFYIKAAKEGHAIITFLS